MPASRRSGRSSAPLVTDSPPLPDVEGDEAQMSDEADLQDDQGLPDELVDEDEEEDEEEVQQFGEEDQVEYAEADSDTTTQSGTDSMSWISWFCSLAGHEYFAEVSDDFIEDDFNLTGLNALVPFYKEALEMVLDVEPEEESLKVPDVSIVESSAELLYGLIHQRYIITRQGLQQMVAKYENAHFGYCPRVYCSTTKVLPCGRSDLPGVDTVKLFCPNCLDTYTPPSSRFNGVDGAFFGTTFPHLLFQTFKEVLPASTAPQASRGPSPAAHSGSADESAMSAATPPPSTALNHAAPSVITSGGTPSGSRIYIPQIYGFKVSERARSGPRMQWLRLRPRPGEEESELARVNNQGKWRDGQGPTYERPAAAGTTAATARGRAGIIDSPRPSPPLRGEAELPAVGPAKRKTVPMPPNFPSRRSSALPAEADGKSAPQAARRE